MEETKENGRHSMRLESGQLLAGRFEVEKQLAKGGMGTVYLAKDLHLHKQVIIKLSEYEELEKEARLQNELLHQAFPRVLDIIKEEQRILLIMEYVDGVTLKEYIERKGNLSESEVHSIGRQILEAIEFLHTRRPAIYYQDLKPENIMIQKDGRVRLIDLGAAVQKQYDGTKSQVIGTKGYAAPEQLGGKIDEIDARSDIYAFGTVLYSMVTGIFLNIPPYIMNSIEVECHEQSNKVKYVIEKCTRAEKESRFTNVEELLEIWESEKTDKYFRRLRKREIKDNDMHKSSNLFQSEENVKEPPNKNESKKKTYTKQTKAIFLSAKLTPGLWIMAWVIQFIMCIFLWNQSSKIDLTHPINSSKLMHLFNSSELNQPINVKEQMKIGENSENEKREIPLIIYNHEGQKLLIKHETTYAMDGSLFFELPPDALDGNNPEILTISLKNSADEEIKERTFFLERK